MLEEQLRSIIRNIPDFPKPGVGFKDITPVLQHPELCHEVISAFIDRLGDEQIDVIAGVESRGFLFGILLASKLHLPFVPIRKKGKLPYKTLQESYELEYGSATIEIHQDGFVPGSKVLIHDDLLATGGTITASSRLVEKMGGKIAGYTFLVELGFLAGRSKLTPFSDQIISLVSY